MDTDEPTREPHFNGPAYEPSRDFKRLSRQHERIRDLMLDGEWRIVHEISLITGDPENSIQAQLRHLRKPRFGAYIVRKRLRPNTQGLWEYRVRPRLPTDPPYRGRATTKELAERVGALETMLQEYVNIDVCLCDEQEKCRRCRATELLASCDDG
jgi:hypothetical protein